MKYINATMQQDRLDALYLVCIEVNVLCKIGYEDLIFKGKKVGENYTQIFFQTYRFFDFCLISNF